MQGYIGVSIKVRMSRKRVVISANTAWVNKHHHSDVRRFAACVAGGNNTHYNTG